MRIATVQHSVPSKRITNADVLRNVREANRPHFSDVELSLLETQVGHLLESAGTSVRYALGDGERAIPLVLDAATRALKETNVSATAVEFVIYVGVGRAFIEPAMANVVQSELGLDNATCFDVMDGCASWLRALQIAQTYIDAGTYECGLIVNCECGFGRYVDWRVARLEDLEFHFATFTIGEAATATLVDGGESGDFYFKFRNFPEHYDLCMIPLDNVTEFLGRESDGRVPMKLFSLSRELLTTAADRIVEMFEADQNLAGQPIDLCFGHSASKKAEEGVLRRLGIPLGTYFGTHASHGNTVSASVPLAISLALQAGRLQRNQKVLVIMAAGGIAIGLARFSF